MTTRSNWNSRLRAAAEGIRDTILPSHVADLPTDATAAGDEAHAPGHQHLGRPDGPGPAKERARARRMARYAKGMRHRISDS